MISQLCKLVGCESGGVGGEHKQGVAERGPRDPGTTLQMFPVHRRSSATDLFDWGGFLRRGSQQRSLRGQILTATNADFFARGGKLSSRGKGSVTLALARPVERVYQPFLAHDRRKTSAVAESCAQRGSE